MVGLEIYVAFTKRKRTFSKHNLKAETIPLTTSEIYALREAKLRRDEDTKWAHREKVKHVHELERIQNIFN
jgi:hypothetical protein